MATTMSCVLVLFILLLAVAVTDAVTFDATTLMTQEELSRRVLEMIAQLTLLGIILSAMVMAAVAWLVWRRLYRHAHHL